MNHIITEAEAAGVPEGVWLDEQIRISRDEAEFAAYWKDAELCAACGWQGVPERVRCGDECIDFCPGCGQAETFHLEAPDDDEA